MNSGFDLVAIGEGMVEFHAKADFASAQTFHRGFAGDVVNSLIHASRLGLRTALVSRIGDDAFAPALLAEWSAEAVDLTHAPVVPGENGLYFILTDANGEREFLYRRAGSAASQIGPGDIDPALLGAARFVLVSGITQAISASAEAAVAAVCALDGARANTVYDPNYRPRLWAQRGRVEAAQRAFTAIAGQVAWILPSFPADLPLIGAEALDPNAALAAFAATSGANVALKLGADGVLLQIGGQVTHVPAVPAPLIVDTTGAGDAWNAAFLHGLARAQAPEQAAAAANRYAAGILGYRGAIPRRSS
jgi:2-dehydro-3-deoxygluconokinase